MLLISAFFLLFIFSDFKDNLPEKIATKNNGLITKICIRSFNHFADGSNLKVPNGMADYACNCFVDEINNGKSIKSAQDYCKTDAEKYYNLKSNNLNS